MNTKQAQTTPNTDEASPGLLRPIPFASVRASTPSPCLISTITAAGFLFQGPWLRPWPKFDGREDTGKHTLGYRMDTAGVARQLSRQHTGGCRDTI
jgi:hypothetical protein